MFFAVYQTLEAALPVVEATEEIPYFTPSTALESDSGAVEVVVPYVSEFSPFWVELVEDPETAAY